MIPVMTTGNDPDTQTPLGFRIFRFVLAVISVIGTAIALVMFAVVGVVSAVIGLIVCLIAGYSPLWGVPASVGLGWLLLLFWFLMDSGCDAVYAPPSRKAQAPATPPPDTGSPDDNTGTR